MIFIYLLGHGIRRSNLHQTAKKYTWLVRYVIWTVLLNIMFFYFHERTLTNNSPVLIIGAVFLFCFILNFEFQNKAINTVASCMFPVFLLQDSYLGQKFYGILYDLGLKYSFEGRFYLILVIYFVLLFLAAIIIELVRQKMMTKPITVLADYLSGKLIRFVESLKI